MTPADELLREYGEEIGVGETFKHTRVGIFFGPAGEEVADPYFGGEGPARTGCLRCGSCMVGCRYGAKNTLVKNYLWFAEKLGARGLPRTPGDGDHARSGRATARRATRSRPSILGPGFASAAAPSAREASWSPRERWAPTSSSPTASTAGSLPRVSDRLGEVVRTNTESVQAVTVRDDSKDFTRSVAITSSIYPDPDTHIEVVTYGRRGDALSRLFTMFTGPGTRATRPLRWIAGMLRHPLQALRLLWPAAVVAADGDPAGDADAGHGDEPARHAAAHRPRA